MLTLFSPRKSQSFDVSIQHANDTYTVQGAFGDIQISVPNAARDVCADFAAWLLLPIAMRAGANLNIRGAGHRQTLVSAEAMSQLWSCWLPQHFKAVSIAFEDIIEEPDTPGTRGLHFFSGGVDSTASIIRNQEAHGPFDLLTVHGLEYDSDNDAHFQTHMQKTQHFCDAMALERKTCRHDAYATYRKFSCNPKGHHITHIFALMGAAFLFPEYRAYFIGSDRRLDQQFMVHPWGSNSASNRFFSDGVRKLVSLDDDLTRAQKLPIVSSVEGALRSLTVCGDKQVRPENCGECSKCTRTKTMFFVSTGSVPEIFKDMRLERAWPSQMNLKKANERAYLFDIVATGKSTGHGENLPGFADACKLAV